MNIIKAILTKLRCVNGQSVCQFHILDKIDILLTPPAVDLFSVEYDNMKSPLDYINYFLDIQFETMKQNELDKLLFVAQQYEWFFDKWHSTPTLITYADNVLCSSNDLSEIVLFHAYYSLHKEEQAVMLLAEQSSGRVLWWHNFDKCNGWKGNTENINDVSKNEFVVKAEDNDKGKGKEIDAPKPDVTSKVKTSKIVDMKQVAKRDDNAPSTSGTVKYDTALKKPGNAPVNKPTAKGKQAIPNKCGAEKAHKGKVAVRGKNSKENQKNKEKFAKGRSKHGDLVKKQVANEGGDVPSMDGHTDPPDPVPTLLPQDENVCNFEVSINRYLCYTLGGWKWRVASIGVSCVSTILSHNAAWLLRFPRISKAIGMVSSTLLKVPLFTGVHKLLSLVPYAGLILPAAATIIQAVSYLMPLVTKYRSVLRGQLINSPVNDDKVDIRPVSLRDAKLFIKDIEIDSVKLTKTLTFIPSFCDWVPFVKSFRENEVKLKISPAFVDELLNKYGNLGYNGVKQFGYDYFKICANHNVNATKRFDVILGSVELAALISEERLQTIDKVHLNH